MRRARSILCICNDNIIILSVKKRLKETMEEDPKIKIDENVVSMNTTGMSVMEENERKKQFESQGKIVVTFSIKNVETDLLKAQSGAGYIDIHGQFRPFQIL